MPAVYVVVKLTVDRDCDPFAVVQECDFGFSDEDGHIQDAEIIELSDEAP